LAESAAVDQIQSNIWVSSVISRSATICLQSESSLRRRRERQSPAKRAVLKPMAWAGQISFRRSLPT